MGGRCPLLQILTLYRRAHNLLGACGHFPLPKNNMFSEHFKKINLNTFNGLEKSILYNENRGNFFPLELDTHARNLMADLNHDIGK